MTINVTSDAYCQCEPKSSVYPERGLEPSNSVLGA